MYFGNQLSNKTSITLHVILQSRIYEIVYLSMSICDRYAAPTFKPTFYEI